MEGERLCALVFIASDADDGAGLDLPPARGPIADRITAYFDGALGAFDEIAVAPRGTPFQLRVWEALRAIPAGQTRSYGELAAHLGAPSATRAVGAANGANPISLVVPCHRVIASTGALHGYGGGLWRKEWLLRHEHALPPELPGLFPRPANTTRGETSG
ncbi:MAG TPA: methylated-DNA--[protein]-cysteine S-methyltransferase [Kofleriaceae bacterium]|nr:methylated-DNA--[protein]-cysteine S-methyltransferase [Kofleriaceae bacterium]